MNIEDNKDIQVQPITYQKDLAEQLFSQVESSPWAMMLRSASMQHVDSRFDILVANPIATLVTYGLETTIQQPTGVTMSLEDPFTLLAQLQAQYLPDQVYHGELPFIGGALGYFGYDLGRRIEVLATQAQHDIAMPDMAIGVYEWAIVIDHQQQTACWVGVNLDNAQRWFSSIVPAAKADFHLTRPWASNMSSADYHAKFEQIADYLLAGDCYQINLAQRFEAQYQGSEWLAYQQLEQSNLAPFSAFIRLPQGAILSVSPERFLKLKQGMVETKPIKGTRPRCTDPQQDQQQAEELAQALKDQAENLMIVDLLRNDIGRVAKPGTVHVPKLFAIESFPAVHHLVSTIRAQLEDGYQATDLLRASFPGGSITGAPKIRAMQIIEELEPHRRSAYCGSIGYISRHGAMDTSITIRTLVTHQQKIYAWAGGGIVADSEWQAEYQETLDKLSRILPILAQ